MSTIRSEEGPNKKSKKSMDAVMSGERKVILMSPHTWTEVSARGLTEEDIRGWDRSEVDTMVAFESQTLKNLIESTEGDTTIPLPTITNEILAVVMEYCKYHVELRNSSDELTVPEDEIKEWDAMLLVKLDLGPLFELILAADYLDVKNLLDLACPKAANMINDLSVEEMRRIFGVENDFTKEEDAAVMKETAWAFTKLDVRDVNFSELI